MRSAMGFLVSVVALCCAMLFPANEALCFDGTLKIGTGSTKGVYYAVGKTLAAIANKYSMLPKVKFAAITSGGSVDNINGLTSGRFHFIIAQADKSYQAWNGQGPWVKAGKQHKLRAVANLYKESITLVVGDDTGIKKLGQIKGRRISLGKEGSGTRQNALDLLKSQSINPSKLRAVLSLGPTESAQKLAAGQIDGFFYTVGHPCPLFKALFGGKRKLRLVGLPFRADMSKIYNYYVSSWIPMDGYRKAANKEMEVRTCGVMATLLVSKDIPAPWVYRFIHAIVFHFKEFRDSHPVLKHLSKANFEGKNWKVSVPYHEGAGKFFKELGVGNKK